ncbi:spore germination protein [Evansella sp. AB-P1]|uniref:spore germination protein n=1 Tax=Evansella sp. AB-P1 TaxID=3037653 RepID=UPI0024203C39|nr:spore germination protein [Evansella sp. AB-P1]MDG5789255.1 spore germination protein [Evansella sp. AB-P1]
MAMKWLNFFHRKGTTTDDTRVPVHAGSMSNEKTNYIGLEQGITYIKDSFSTTDDLIINNKLFHEKKLVTIYLDPYLDKDLYQKAISLLSHDNEAAMTDQLKKSFDVCPTLDYAIQKLLDGKCVILYEGVPQLFVVNVRSSFHRGVDEPINERIVIGQHEGFVESLKVNQQLLRKRIIHTDLIIKNMTIGTKTNTSVSIIYVEGLADSKVVKKIWNELDSLSISSVESSGAVMQLIEEHSFSPFPQMLNTERPDRAAANLMEGRIVLMFDGSPSVLILPVSLFTFFQSPDDYNTRWIMGSFYRAIRLASFFIAVTFPAFYIAVVSFHPEVIPSGLILIVKQAVDDIPYPHIVEAFIMEMTLELLREASIRLPNPIGQTIGIVGGLVIGDAIVRAGLVSNIMIIIVAITAISSFVVPSHEMSSSIRLLRFPMMFSAAIFGFVGIVYFYLLLIIHLCRLESFGTSYLSPLVPLKLEKLKDSFIRFPTWSLKNFRRPGNKKRKSAFKEWDDFA